ncbi:hydrolase [Salinivibrio sp. PR5]|uniref:hydrolase n=1 Tax=unclassified Salinivibrio TaxID=2636825 RepID=UPI00098912A7|nr:MULTISPECIES: hydrolase [unclassified Salinivibrio]OOF11642.1 hydrolase [Salinivibrio sp. PR5]OOF17356.1 hydrolase [Salinivibrio sp. PR932]
MTPFEPIPSARNPHLQTIMPRLIRRQPVLSPLWQQLDLPDGDFVDLAWTQTPKPGQPIVVLFHGLAGSFHSPYANGLLAAFQRRGWCGVVMHFRSCSGRLNRVPRTYHSGETQDARYFLTTLRMRYPQHPIHAVGVSLGGNMLVRYLAEYADDPIVSSGCAVSPPLDLAACSLRIQQGFSRVYQAYLLRSMRQTLSDKLTRHAQVGRWQAGEQPRIATLFEFDQTVTAPLHGFEDAHHYYQQCSGLSVLPAIRTPLTIIHAKDDPFMTDAVIPTTPLPANIRYQLTDHGGHVGFVTGRWRAPRLWLEEAVPAWIAEQLDT